MNGTAGAAQRLPGADFAVEDLRQLRGVQGRQRVLRMQDDCQAVNGDHLLGLGAFQVAQGFKVDQFAVLDRARRRRKVGAGVFKRAEPGAGAMGGHLDNHALALTRLADHPLFVGAFAGLGVHRLQALVLHQTLDQRGPQGRTNGIGALDAQCGALVGNGQGSGDSVKRQQ